jgi:hypothetical protein
MMTYQRSTNGQLLTQRELETGDQLVITADAIRRQSTGVHARLAIFLNNTYLTHSNLNVERDEDRIRLANSAYAQFGSLIQTAYPAAALKHDLGIFSFGLWSAYLDIYSAEACCAESDGQPPEFYLKPYVMRGGGTIGFAPPGRGKSYWAVIMAICIDAGISTLWPVKQAKVMVINLERSRESVRHRIRQVNRCLNEDPSRPLLVLNARGRRLADIVAIAQRDIERHGVEVVILDSISRAGYGDLTENGPVNAIIDALNGLSPTWVALAHTPRSDESHVYGSIHFEAGEDIGVQLLTQRGPDGTLGIGFHVVKANDMAIPPLDVLALEFDENGLTAAYRARRHQFPEIECGRKLSLTEMAREYLLLVGKADADEIAKEIGKPRPEVSRYLTHDANFGKERAPGRGGRILFYVLSEGEA